jgi:hypothetical protein
VLAKVAGMSIFVETKRYLNAPDDVERLAQLVEKVSERLSALEGRVVALESNAVVQELRSKTLTENVGIVASAAVVDSVANLKIELANKLALLENRMSMLDVQKLSSTRPNEKKRR